MTDLLAAGHYYSSQAAGAAAGAWALRETVKVTNATCVNGRVVDAVRRLNRGAFARCADDDIKSDCVIESFYQSVLGNKTAGGVGPGIAAAVLIDAFEAAFESDDPAAGGCPALPLHLAA